MNWPWQWLSAENTPIFESKAISIMNIALDDNGTKGKAYVGDKAQPSAEMTFTWAGKDKMIIDHTHVDDSLRGKGAGKQMLMKLVAKAREEGFTILPLCPFARSVFQKDRSLKDVWA